MSLSGLPHSEILGSKPVCGSPKLFAAYHVLHRLLAPRHSPYALSSLTILNSELTLAAVRCPLLAARKPPELRTANCELRSATVPCALFRQRFCTPADCFLWSEKTTVCRIFSCKRARTYVRLCGRSFRPQLPILRSARVGRKQDRRTFQSSR